MTVKDILSDWAGGSQPREKLVAEKELVLRWLNEAQLQFVDKSEVLRDVWTATFGSDGILPLPDDFLRVARDRVLWSGTNDVLTEGDYGTLKAINAQGSIGGTYHYAIWGGNFYVFSPASGTATIPYVKKPSVHVSLNDDLEIPSEYHQTLITFLDGKYMRMSDKFAEAEITMRAFAEQAKRDGTRNSLRVDGVPYMRGGML